MSGYDPFPPYTPSVPTGTEAAVCNDIARRQQVGIRKYGTTVAANPLNLRQWLQHAYEETLDQAVYLKRAIEEIDAKTVTVPARPFPPRSVPARAKTTDGE